MVVETPTEVNTRKSSTERPIEVLNSKERHNTVRGHEACHEARVGPEAPELSTMVLSPHLIAYHKIPPGSIGQKATGIREHRRCALGMRPTSQHVLA